MASKKQAEHLSKLRERRAAKYKGGALNSNTAYQENTDSLDPLAVDGLLCSEPGCRHRWVINAEGIFKKCSIHAWIARSRELEAPPPWLDPFEGVPLFREYGPRAWAHRLKYRDERGDELTDYQREKYRAALARA